MKQNQVGFSLRGESVELREDSILFGDSAVPNEHIANIAIDVVPSEQRRWWLQHARRIGIDVELFKAQGSRATRHNI